MARTAFIYLLLVSLAALSASAMRADAVRTRAHASIAKPPVHRARKTVRPASARTPLHSSRSSAVNPRRSAASHSVGRRSTRSSSYHGRRVASNSPRYRATLRRTRYNRYRSGARYVPMAAAASRTGTMNLPEASGDSAPSSAAGPSPRAANSIPTANAPAAEPDTTPALGEDPAPVSAAGNPLAAPRETRQPVGSIAGQVAELNRPLLFAGPANRYTLRGTHDSLVRQNTRSEEEALERIEDDADLQDRIAHGMLVRVPESGGLLVNPALPEDRRYCRQWTADFLSDLSRAHQSEFHRPLIVSSAVRTVEYQKRLMRVNRNAADAEGDVVSPHLTGATIDIAKSGLSRKEMQWMRDHLFAYQTAGVIDVEEEFRQRCFHITVYKNYAPASSPNRPHHAPVPQTVPPDPSTAAVGEDPAASNR